MGNLTKILNFCYIYQGYDKFKHSTSRKIVYYYMLKKHINNNGKRREENFMIINTFSMTLRKYQKRKKITRELKFSAFYKKIMH